MSYSGSTYAIPCEKGGLTANPNIDAIQPYMMVSARNINIHENGRGKRGGTAKVNASAGYGSSQIMGGFDYIKLNGTQKLVIGTTAGSIYQNPTTTIKTSLTTGKYFNFEVFEDELYICNGGNTPQTWDGAAASTSDITNPAADWTGSNQPIQMVKHGRGNSERMWAILPSGVYASADGDAKEFVTGVVNIPISTDDGSGLTGGVEFGDRLILFSKRRSFLIDDADTNTANWGYESAIWEGGVSHHRLIVKTPNDILCMMDDGNIYSVTSVQSYGDYKTASITKPSWIDKWIRENCDLGQIDKFHATYDPELRLIKWFVVRSGQTQVDTCLVYFIDRGPEEGWVIHDNPSSASGYSASASWVYHKMPAEHHSFYIYTGDYSGFVWDLEETNKNDDGNGYYAGFKTARIPLDNVRLTKNMKRGWLITQAEGSYNVYVKCWIDGVEQT
ncbi:MAG: hypothetical protein NUW09_07830, partial [Deltaproteobacteria bacterium]|nr:hypothetical protein [Deltaproteobacteria bacterium]